MHKKIVATYLLFSIALISTAASASVLDQFNLFEQPTSGSGGYLISPGYRIGQTFEVGFDGYLDAVQVQFSFANSQYENGEELVFAIYMLSDGLPSGDPLAVAAIHHDNVPILPLPLLYSNHVTLTLDFSSQGLFLNQGTSYALVADTTSLIDTWGVWVHCVDYNSCYDAYSGGSGLYQSGQGSWSNLDLDQPDIAFDSSFATYLTPIPLPSALTLMLCGMMGLAIVNTSRIN